VEHADLERIVFDTSTLADRVAQMGRQIATDYHGRTPLLIGVLKGSVVFMTDLVRQIDLRLEIDFMAVSSYGDSTRSSGEVRIHKDLDRSIEDRHVILIEDIVDTGLTLHFLTKILRARKPASLALCSLLDKPEARVQTVDLRYVGFTCPNDFVVGYGLDYRGEYRNLPYIGMLSRHVYGG